MSARRKLGGDGILSTPVDGESDSDFSFVPISPASASGDGGAGGNAGAADVSTALSTLARPSPVTRGAYGAVSTSDDTFERGYDEPLVQRKVGVSSDLLVSAAALLCVTAIAVAITLGVLLSGRGDGGGGDDGCGYTGYILQPVASPSSYAVYWNPLFTEPFTFHGNTTAIVHMLADGQRCLQMHAAPGLTISTISVNGQTAPSWRGDTVNERVVITLPSVPAAGATLVVEFVFSGNLGRDMTGLYLSTYTDDTGHKVNMVTTQFEATFARRAFPCFDEPAYKAVFNVTLDNVPQGYTPLGNMPVAAIIPAPDNTSRVTFQPSPRMSTYLVAVVAAPLIKVTGVSGQNNVVVSVYAVARADNAYRISYALDAGMRVLTYYETTLGVPYPLPKLDMVAIPDFAAGAMENWGLITYRETALLANASLSSASELQRVTVVVAHEIAHQWFGNLVTMAWWSALWLNEGDASLWEYLGTQAVHPDFQIMRQFVTSDVAEAMSSTWYGNSRQLINTVDSSAQIEASFDGVAYSFGGSILYSLKNFLDRARPGSYFAGMNRYLNRLAYSNGQPSDFWQALADTASLPALPTDMETYTNQVGYPVITLAWANADGPTTGVGTLTVSQARHFLSPYSQSQAPPADPIWWIPLTLAGQHPTASSGVPDAAAAALSQGGFSTKMWKTTIGSTDTGRLYSVGADGWVKANVNATGFYRVNYPLNVWTAFQSAVLAQMMAGASGPLFAPDRGNLVDDLYVFAFGRMDVANGIDMPLWLNFSQYLRYETEYEAWIPAISHLLAVRQLLIPDGPGNAGTNAQCLADLNTYAGVQLTPIFNTLGFTGNQSPLTVMLRSAVLSAGSLFNMSAVVTGLRALYNAGSTAIPANIQPAVYSSVVRWGSTADFNDVVTLYEQAGIMGDSAAQRRFLSALAASTDSSNLQALLSKALDPDVVRPQDTVSVIAAVAGNAVGRDVAWSFVKANWPELNLRYGSGGFALSSLVSSTTACFQSTSYANDITNFYAANPIPGAVLELAQGLEMINAKAAWVAGDLSNTCTWLRNYAAAQGA